MAYMNGMLQVYHFCFTFVDKSNMKIVHLGSCVWLFSVDEDGTC